jgi:hypothetical protein
MANHQRYPERLTVFIQHYTHRPEVVSKLSSVPVARKLPEILSMRGVVQ